MSYFIARTGSGSSPDGVWERIFDVEEKNFLKIYMKRYSAGYKYDDDNDYDDDDDTTPFPFALLHIILISVCTNFCLLSPNELACLQHNPCSFSLSDFSHQLENL